MAAAVRTVLGDIPAGELGVCDSHDHLFLRSPLLPGEELDDPRAAEAELIAFRALGGRAVVQWTPFGLGRRAGDLVRLSRRCGVHVVAATGLHQAAHYPPALLDDVMGRLTEIFVEELTLGLSLHGEGEEPRAGMIKVAGRFHVLDEHARRVMTAAAEAHHATGAPIGVHLELGTAGPAVLDLLCDRLKVPAPSVVLGHVNRSPDPRTHQEIAERGAYLAFDGPTPAGHATDWRLFDLLAGLVAQGHEDRLLLGADTTSASARAAGGCGPGMPYLLGGLRTRLERELGETVVGKLLAGNPARAFAADWRPDRPGTRSRVPA
ncbi:phosphotriesterase [Microtetraspora sp. NBRC 13810]|uniref:phosphotriesterase family protein n=1 Tax=Microtetraspora sp. NBRC 13810 TaxID=3030990 RepID=UPI0024A4DC6A|nr:hypothetical protein [Microtetraspora sp. NBRC 13810]GLW07769.1 phosphotriesterase [Microtetraspora sp. NBRC 13810]